MGLFDKINEKALGGASKLIKGKINSTIEKLIKEKRLVSVVGYRVSYTNKQGETRVISIDEMVAVLVDAAGSGSLLQVGIMPDDVKNILVAKLNEKKGNK